MDSYQELRLLPLREVLAWLGFPDATWKARKNGTEFSGRCPVHQPKANSTSFSYDSEGRFNCFSCGAHGRGAIDITMAVKQIGFQEAVKLLQEFKPRAAPISPSLTNVKPEEPEVNENPVFKASYEKYFKPHEWLDNRGLLPTTLQHFGVGFYENPARRSVYNGSVMLKIRRYSDGECVGYLVRNIGDVSPEKPKYVFPKGLSKSVELFGAFQLKEKAPIRVLYVVESPFAVMAFHQKGFPAVSPFGWSLSDQQIEIISQLAKGVVYLPDLDKHSEISDSVRRLALHVWVKSPALPEGITDPEYLSAEQIRSLA